MPLVETSREMQPAITSLVEFRLATAGASTLTIKMELKTRPQRKFISFSFQSRRWAQIIHPSEIQEKHPSLTATRITMNASNLNQMHADPDNWHLVFFYICSADPRIVVKKRIGAMGWTLNFARPLAIPFLVILVAAIYGVMRISDMLALGDTGYWITVVLLILGIVSLCGWLSNPDRHTKRRGEQ